MKGYGFLSWRGGLMHDAETVGLPAILVTARETKQHDGHGCEVSPILAERASQGRGCG